jgi:hypothetical protein
MADHGGISLVDALVTAAPLAALLYTASLINLRAVNTMFFSAPPVRQRGAGRAREGAIRTEPCAGTRHPGQGGAHARALGRPARHQLGRLYRLHGRSGLVALPPRRVPRARPTEGEPTQAVLVFCSTGRLRHSR